MMFREIFRLEFSAQIRSRSTWLFGVVLAVLAFLFVRGNYLADALYADFFVNSPFVIAGTAVFCTLFWFLLAAPVAGRAGARDPETGIDPLLYTTRVSRSEYLGGRFLAALLVNVILLCAVPAGILLAVYAPGVDPAVIGPFRPDAYLTTIAYILLPNAFIGTAIQFAWGVLGRRTIGSYVGSLLLFFLTYGGMIVLGVFIGRQDLAALLDVFGHIFITSELILGWTPIEKSSRLIALEGPLLWSRLVWISIALATLVFTYTSFRFVHHSASGWLNRLVRRTKVQAPTPSGRGISHGGIIVPDVRPTFGPTTFIRQLLEIASVSFRTIIKSRTGLPILIGLAALVVLVLPEAMHNMGTPLLPRTEYLLSFLTAPITTPMTPWIVIPLLIVFYSGDLVWRDRQAGLGEITDAAPVSEWILILGRFLGLALTLVLWISLLTLAGLMVQVRMGYTGFEIGLMLKVLFGLQLPEYLLFAILALVVQGMIRRRYVGHLVALLAYLFILFAPSLGIEHRLLIFGSAPSWSYTDMRGFGLSLEPWRWFMFYWGAWGLLLIVIGKLLWVRGMEGSLRMRLTLARDRLTRMTAWIAAGAVGLVGIVGGFIFYNTIVLNEYSTDEASKDRQARYELRYGQYAGIPQPIVTGTNLRVEIHPNELEVEIQGSHILENRNDVSIDSIHVGLMPGEVTEKISFDRTFSVQLVDDDHGHRIYHLADPLQPGDSLRIDFTVRTRSEGFRNNGLPTVIGPNSTYFRSIDLLPSIGYQSARELIKPGERRLHGLPSRPLIPRLADAGGDITGEEHDIGSGSERLSVETIVGTVHDQVAVATGTLRRTWTEKGRRYFHYVTGTPVGQEYAIFSSDYAVIEEEWVDRSADTPRTIAIQIYHHPEHSANVDRMLASVRASMSNYTRSFGPYQWDYIRLVESPGTGIGAHAEPTTINYSEGFSRFDPDGDTRRLDLPFAVMAHEMAHQWGVPYAFVEGAPLLTESFAWYAAIGVVEETYGGDHLHRLMRFFRQPTPIPPIRQSVPLLRAADPYAAYRKGPFALYGLSEYIGKDRVDLAFRRLIATHRGDSVLPATTLHLYRELKRVTPDSLRPLLHDLFAANTIWDLATERVTARENSSGMWEVTLEVRARKVTLAPSGVETEFPLNEWIEIGIYAPTTPGSDYGEKLYLQKHRIRSGLQTIRVTVRDKPSDAGVDPYHLLFDPERYDNVEEVEIATK